MDKRTALFSTYNKEGIVEFAQTLLKLNFDIIATNNTAKLLLANQIPVLKVEELTDFPEILDGRVKTLHPKIHGGILFNRNNPTHNQIIQQHKIKAIDLVFVNLYPFEQTINTPAASETEIIEKIDIGGPTLIRAAAKNFAHCLIITDNQDVTLVGSLLQNQSEVDGSTRQYLASKAFVHVAHYDLVIANYFSKKNNTTSAEFTINEFIHLQKKQNLRYGENPHQQAIYYQDISSNLTFNPSFSQLHGKELSYNNLKDMDAAFHLINDFDSMPTVAAIKHNNPCAISSSKEAHQALINVLQADSVSIFGGIVIFTHTVETASAELLSTLFLEIIIAPNFTKEALDILTQKKNVRIISYVKPLLLPMYNYRSIMGGFLKQATNQQILKTNHLVSVSGFEASEQEKRDLIFAFTAVKHVVSNAIIVATNLTTVGIGAGQMNRLQSAHLAFDPIKAKNIQTNLVLASDAFFPFKDIVELCAKNHIKAIIQPGGSINDPEVIRACENYQIPLYFTTIRHFKH